MTRRPWTVRIVHQVEGMELMTAIELSYAAAVEVPLPRACPAPSTVRAALAGAWVVQWAEGRVGRA